MIAYEEVLREKTEMLSVHLPSFEKSILWFGMIFNNYFITTNNYKKKLNLPGQCAGKVIKLNRCDYKDERLSHQNAESAAHTDRHGGECDDCV